MVRIPATKSTTYHTTLFVRGDKRGRQFKRYLVISTYVASPLSQKYFAVEDFLRGSNFVDNSLAIVTVGLSQGCCTVVQ